jgi:Cache domain
MTHRHAWELLAIVAVLCVAAIFLVHQRSVYASALTQDQLRSYAKLAAMKYEALTEESQGVLFILANLPEVQRDDMQACDAVLSTIDASSSVYANMGVVTLDGSLWCSAHPFRPAPDLSDRAYFQDVVSNNEFSVSDYMVDGATGEPSITFAAPVEQSNGITQKVVFVSIATSWLQKLAQSINLPTGSTVIIVDNLGTTLARYPEASDETGKLAPEVAYKPEQITYLEQGLGEIETTDPAGNSYYLIAVPLRIDDEDGYLHLIMTIPTSYIEPR